jgi:hypothetical protein
MAAKFKSGLFSERYNSQTVSVSYSILCSVRGSLVSHSRTMRHIRPAITDNVAKTVACSIVGARLDYANSLLCGVTQKNTHRLLRIQNKLARVVAGSPYYVCLFYFLRLSLFITCTGYLLTFVSIRSLLNLHSFPVPHPTLLMSHHSSDPIPRLAIFVPATLVFSLFLITGYK